MFTTPSLVNSGSLVSGRTYTITDSGTGTNTGRFPGATSNDVGVVFTATGTGNGTGGNDTGNRTGGLDLMDGWMGP